MTGQDPPAAPPPARRDWFTRMRKSKAVVRLVWTAEQAGKLAILVTIVNYFLEAPDRLKSKEFQAWQLVNSARTGDGGRKLALHDLVQDDVDLSGLDLDGANLFGADLRGGELSRVSFMQADLDNTNFSCRPGGWLPLLLQDGSCKPTDLEHAVFTAPMNLTSFQGARLDFAEFSTPRGHDTGTREAVGFLKFSHASVYAAQFHDLDVWDTDFSDARLERTHFDRVQFQRTSFDRADLRSPHDPGSHTVFSDVAFVETSFAGADLSGATFVNAAVEPPSAQAIMNALLCRSGDPCAPASRPLTEDDLKGARLCGTMVNGQRSDRDCGPATHLGMDEDLMRR
jgi:uncharacterized protein YjbI with pentapeptide repeats